MTREDFDATTVDPETVRFGPGGASVDTRGGGKLKAASKDVDHDGDLDLVMHFRTQETGISAGDEEACLTGETFGGQAIWGCDSVRTVPPAGDADGDSLGLGSPLVFSDDVEASVGTDQLANCPRNHKHDAWPPDLNKDGVVSLTDAGFFPSHIQSVLGDAAYQARLDLVFDGRVAISDVLVLKPFLNVSCSAADTDTDGDGVKDQLDDDDDNDGYTDLVEVHVSTDPLLACGQDAWPIDVDSNRKVNVVDILQFKGVIMTEAGDPNYKRRYDLYADNKVNIVDVMQYRGWIFAECT